MTYPTSHPSAKPLLLFVGAALASSGLVEQLRRALDVDFTDQHATSVEAAVHCLCQQSCSLVICEDTSSDPVAAEIVQLTKQLQPQLPIIVISSGAVTAQRVTTFMRAGAAGVVEELDTAYLAQLVAEELRAPLPASTKPKSTSILPSPEHQVDIQITEVLDSMQDALICFSLPDHKIIFASASVETIFGYPLARFREDRNFFRQIVHPDDLELALEAMQRGLRNGFTEIDHRIILPDGSVRWLHRRMWINYDAHGNPIRSNDSARDITERKLAETALRTSEERQRAILNGIPDLVFRLDANGIFIDYRAPTNLLFAPPEAFLGRHFGDVLPPIIAQQLDVAVRHLQDSLEPIRFDYPATFDDQPMFFEARIIPVNHGELVCIVRNITEQKTAELALQASEEKYRSLIESTDSAVALYDVNGIMLFANQIAARSLGFTPETIAGQSMHSLFPPEVAGYQLSGIQRVINTGIGHVSESQSFVGGEPRWYRTSIQPVRDATGNVTAALINASDITQIKTSEEALRQSEAYLRSLVNSETAYNLRIDTQGMMNYCNERFRRQFAWKAPSLIGHSPLITVHSDDHTMVIQAIRDSLMVSGKPVQLEIRMLTADGGQMWTHWEFSAVSGLNSTVQEINCVGFDITRQKRAEAALQESNQRLEARVTERTAQLQQTTDRLAAIIDHSGDGIVLINVEHGIQQANHAFNTLIGLTEADYLGRQLSVFFQTGNTGELDAVLSAAAENHETLRIETLVNQANVPPRLVEISIAPVNRSTAAVTNLVCIIRDITERKHAEEAIRQTLAREKELSELKSRFVSMASHEFRTPLASILATTETLVLYRDRLDAEKINERLKRISLQVAHMTGIVDDVLQLSRIQTGRVKFDPHSGDLCKLCVAIITEFASQPEYHGRLMYACTEPSVPAVFDERLLRQAISNLVHNALKYSPNGHPVHVTLGHNGELITLTVRDEGIGIPEADQERLFNPFHRAGNVGSISGTGLGLSIAKEAVELHQGSITLESQVGVGTTFTVALPITG